MFYILKPSNAVVPIVIPLLFKKMNYNDTSELTPGTYVINENNREWGIGQVQSSIKEKVTINFEHVGKKVININKILLKIVKV